MLKSLHSRDLMVRIVLGVILGFVSLGMLLYLVPAPVSSLDQGTEGIADVAGERITATELRRQLNLMTSHQSIPPSMQPLFAKRILDDLVFERLLVLEGEKLGIRVTDQELSDRIKLILPSVFIGGTWAGQDRYATEVQVRFNMSVDEFERQLRSSLLEEKLRQLVTEGITVAPEEVQQEFQRRNEKVKIDYVLITPGALESQVNSTEGELQSYFEKNKSKYEVPERRSARYLLVELNALRQHAPVGDDELRAYYNQHLDAYKVPNRVHVQHILLKTVGKTDAEVAEIRKNAEDILKQVKKGANFEELAKKNSEDTGTKAKGGDLGWIVQGQTVPDFEQVAFSLPEGAVSDLVKTQYGFHIIKVLDHETAHTKSFEEVRISILPIVLNDKIDRLASQVSEKMADAVRQSSRRPLEEVAKSIEPLVQQGSRIGETPLAGVNDPMGELGVSPDVRDALFRQRPGELSLPIRIDRGYVVLAVKDVVPSHQGTFAEVRSQVETEFRKEKAAELAHSRADQLAHRAQSGETLAQAAKALGLEIKTSDAFTRTGSVPGLGGASQLASAFTMPVGRTSSATASGANWVVFSVASREEPNPEDFAKQKSNIESELETSKRQAAYDAFRHALEDEMKRQGKLRINADNLKRVTGGTSNQL